MSEKKHIDRLFQEKFKDFEVAPKEQVWKNIEKELKKKERKPFVLPLWYRIAGVAAVLTIIFLAGNLIFNNAEKIQVVHSEEKGGTEIQDPVETKTDSGTNAISLQQNDSGEKSYGKNEDSKKENAVKAIGTAKENVLVSTNRNDSESNPKNKSKTGTNTISSDKKSRALHVVVQTQKKHRNKNVIENTAVTKDDPETSFSENYAEKYNVEEQNGLVTTGNNSKKNNQSSDVIDGKKSLLDAALAKEQQEKDAEKIKTVVAETSKFQISPFAAPIYYGGFGEEYTLGPRLAKNGSESQITMSYGVNFSYKISEHLKIRSGISQVSMNYQVNNIAFSATVQPTALRNVAYNSASGDLKIISQKNIVPVSGLVAYENPYTQGILNQQMGFIEIPLELEYFLIDKKFELSLIGGMSTLFLNENSISIKSANGTTNIGEASNLNDLSFSTNFGLGLGYDITEKFEINMEPMFKYQLNTFTGNSNEFKPYYLGVYTGFSFKF